MNKTLRTILLVFFSVVFLFSAVMLTRELIGRRISAAYITNMQKDFQPTLRVPKESASSSAASSEGSEDSNENGEASTEEETPVDLSNPEIRELVDEYPDAVGWLTVEGAGVSLPFAIGVDNSTYLRKALDGSYVRAGTLFLDFRSNRDMTDNLTVLFGHNLQNGTMFSDLKNYLDSDYLAENGDVYVSLPDTTIHYRVWASMVAHAVSDPIFSAVGNTADMNKIIDHVSSNAQAMNSDVSVDSGKRVLVLSTCNPTYFYARTLLICVED